MRSNILFVLLATTLSMAVAADAAAQATVNDLSQIQSETIILRAKVNRAAALQELEAKGKGAVPGYMNDDIDAPVVKAVYGAGKQLYATFLYSSGVVMDAKAGDLILGGFKVVSVNIEKVELAKGGTHLQIGFAGTAPSRTPAQSPGMAPGPYIPSPAMRQP